jgi:hypothetical protein
MGAESNLLNEVVFRGITQRLQNSPLSPYINDKPDFTFEIDLNEIGPVLVELSQLSASELNELTSIKFI